MVLPSVSTQSLPSSSTLWATGQFNPAVPSASTLIRLYLASKEWVIAPKPKPGRKPKKDPSNSITTKADSDVIVDAKGRRVQNRAAQRAFRERKQSQLAELQARVQSYEQGEIERNVALQRIAKRLKEENESLRTENALLKERLAKSGLVNSLSEGDKKRSRDDTLVSNSTAKRVKAVMNPLYSTTQATFTLSPHTTSSPCSPATSDNACSPLPTYDMQPDDIHTSQFLALSPVKTIPVDGDAYSSFECGFCSEDTGCMCREIVQQAHTINNYNQADLSPDADPANDIPLISSAPPILENLPPYQPPVPLRRRPVTSNTISVFPVISSAPQAPPANCSGDPSNCMACADDAFGKAFCSAIEASVATQQPCTDCPCIQTVSSSIPSFASAFPNNCCGNPSNCHCVTSSMDSGGAETMPTSDAWRQLKAHPNVSFADLTLLAEVVARRSKCTGPSVVISPPLGSATPECKSSPAPFNARDQEPILLTDPHAHYHEKELRRSSPRLVPQEVLIRCGRQRVREVQTDAVHAALRLLDAKFT
ncbi:hypothetical protein H0H92_001483 [Tricholoma furcatifolium]|nr:hypothetical protein H0H92_001483 [Tricholoma furcatifolium]